MPQVRGPRSRDFSRPVGLTVSMTVSRRDLWALAVSCTVAAYDRPVDLLEAVLHRGYVLPRMPHVRCHRQERRPPHPLSRAAGQPEAMP
jgi:hypothetical protein